MPYEVIVPEPIEKEIRKRLDKHLVLRLNKRIEKLEENPEIHGKPLRFPMAGTWEIRFEKRWRILYEIDFQKKQIIIVGLKHKDEM